MVQKIEIPLVVNEDGTVVLAKYAEGLDTIEKKGRSAQSSLADFGKELLAGVGLGAGFKVAEVAADSLLSVLKAAPATFAEWTSRALKAADTLSNLSASTDISAEGLQRLERIGLPAGVSLDEMAAKALKLQQRMETTPQAFERMGLSVERLKALGPERALEEVVKAAHDIKEPTEQAAASLQLFGDRGGEMLRIIRAGLRDVEDFGELTNRQVGDLDNLGDTVGEAETAWRNLTIQLAATIAQSPEILGMLKDVAAGVGGMAAAVRDNGPFITQWFSLTFGAVEELVPQIKQLHGALIQMASDPKLKTPVWSPDNITPPSIDFDAIFRDAQIEIGKVGGESAKAKAEVEKLKREQEQAARAQEKWNLTMLAAIPGLQKFAEEQRGIADAKMAEKLFAQAETWQNHVADTRAEYDALLESEVAATKEGEFQAQKMAEETAKAVQGLRALAGAVGEFGGSVGTIFSGLFNTLANLNDEAVRGASIWEKMAGVVSGAFAAFKSGSILGGAMSGAQAGAAFGPLGALIGGGIGGLIGGIGKLFGHNEVKQINDLRDAFFAAHGGFAAFSKEMAAVSREDWAAKIFKAKTVDDFNRLVKEAQGLLDLHGQAAADIDAAMERYGLTADKTAKELDASAQDIFKNWKLLTEGALIPAADVIEKMAPDVQAWLDRVKEAGGQVPENMKPVIEAMLAQGKLVDANGEAYKTAEEAGISYTKSLSEGMAELVDYMKQILEAWTGIGAAARSAGRDIAGVPRPQAPYGGDYGYPDTGPPEGMPPYASGVPSIPFTGPKLLHRGEAVINTGGVPGTEAALGRMADRLAGQINRASSGGGPIVVQAQLVLDGKVLATATQTLVREDSGVRAEVKRAVAGRY